MLTQDKLKSILNYDRNTGFFIWKRHAGVKTGSLAGKKLLDGYILITINRQRYRAHRLAWLYEYGYFPDLLIDHADGNPSNNRIANLRLATSTQNNCNAKMPITNTSGVKGVSFNKRLNKWGCSIRVLGVKKHLGYFLTLDDAKLKVELARKFYHGDFARN